MITPSFSIRRVLFSLLLAIALWLFVSMRSSYDIVTLIPVEYVLPANRSIETVVPSEVRVKLHATGWHLLNILYLNAQSSCVVDFSSSTDSILHVQAADLKKAFRSPVPATVVEVFDDEFEFRVGVVGQKTVLVVSRVHCDAAPGFLAVGNTMMNPGYVTVRGNTKILATISSWPTKELILNNVRDDVSGFVALSDSLRSIVSIEPRSVSFKVQVQRSADVEITDVPVSIINAPAETPHSVRPLTISVRVRGGVEEIASLSKEKISASIDYLQVISDTTGVVQPVVKLPANLVLLEYSPSTLLHSVAAATRPNEKVMRRRRN